MHTLNPYSSYWHLDGEIIKDIGNTYDFFPTTMVCGLYSFGPLRCYEDRYINIKLSSIACDSIKNIWANPSNSIKVSVYPIPTQSDLFVKIDTDQELEYDLEIYSEIGQRIITMNNLYEKNIKIPLESLSTGVYFLKIYPNRGLTILRKIIKSQ